MVDRKLVGDAGPGDTANPPNDLPSGLCSGVAPPCRIVFTSSATFTGALGGLAGADNECQQLASAAGLPGTFKAWLSDATGSPSTRFAQAPVPYLLVDGTVVANDWTELTSGTIQHALDQSETGGPPGRDDSGNACMLPVGATIVWTSTRSDGTAVPGTDCSNWTSSLVNAPSQWGRNDAASSFWSTYCSSGSCSWHAPLYCFQQ